MTDHTPMGVSHDPTSGTFAIHGLARDAADLLLTVYGFTASERDVMLQDAVSASAPPTPRDELLQFLLDHTVIPADAIIRQAAIIDALEVLMADNALAAVDGVIKPYIGPGPPWSVSFPWPTFYRVVQNYVNWINDPNTE